MADLKNTDDLMNSPTGIGFGAGLPLEKQDLLCPTSSRLLTSFFSNASPKPGSKNVLSDLFLWKY